MHSVGCAPINEVIIFSVEGFTGLSNHMELFSISLYSSKLLSLLSKIPKHSTSEILTYFLAPPLNNTIVIKTSMSAENGH